MPDETAAGMSGWSEVCPSIDESTVSSVDVVRCNETSEFVSLSSEFNKDLCEESNESFATSEIETFDIKYFLSNLHDEVKQLEQRKKELWAQALAFNLEATTNAVAGYCTIRKLHLASLISQFENILLGNDELEDENNILDQLYVNRTNTGKDGLGTDVSSSADSFMDPSINNLNIIAADNEQKSMEQSEYLPLFNQWIHDFKNDMYDYAPKERQRRLKIFVTNLQEIERLNQKYGPATTFRLNECADLTWDEFKIRFHSCAPDPSPDDWEGNPNERNVVKLTSAPGLPRKLSYRKGEQQIVTPVKNQGNCSAGWAFATVAVAESMARKVEKGNSSFSEQQILDIFDDEYETGYVRNAFRQLQDFGVYSETAYPYTGVVGNRQYGEPLMKLSNIKDLPRDELRMAYSLKEGGPFAVTFKVGRSFQFYKSGILSANDCDNNEDLWHSVAVVGFGTGYWEIKNSLGSSWGKAGFGQVQRGFNWCHIEDGPTTGWF